MQPLPAAVRRFGFEPSACHPCLLRLLAGARVNNVTLVWAVNHSLEEVLVFSAALPIGSRQWLTAAHDYLKSKYDWNCCFLHVWTACQRWRHIKKSTSPCRSSCGSSRGRGSVLPVWIWPPSLACHHLRPWGRWQLEGKRDTLSSLCSQCSVSTYHAANRGERAWCHRDPWLINNYLKKKTDTVF